MNRLGTVGIAGLAALVVIVLVAGASLFTVSQTEQVLITQFGQPVRVIKDPGLHAKVPFVQTVLDFDNRLLDFNTTGEEVILADQRRLTIDSFTRYRITDPLRFFQAAGPSEDGIRGRLNSVVTSALRRVLGNETLLNVLSANRNRIMGLIKTQVSDEMRNFGVDIEDVRIRRADLPRQISEQVFARMSSEYARQAAEYRATGQQQKRTIEATADRDAVVLIGAAQQKADTTRGEGDAIRNKVYADAYGKDRDFFAFYRSMAAYDTAFAGKDTRLVVSPVGNFFRFFKSPSGEPAAKTDAPAAAPAKPQEAAAKTPDPQTKAPEVNPASPQ